MLRISVVKNEQEFPLYMGNTTSTSIEQDESLFDLEAALRTGYSMNLQIPVEGNELALDQAHRVTVKNEMDLYIIRIYERDIPSYTATLAIEKSSLSSNSGFFDCNIIYGSFGTLTDQLLLKDALKDVFYILGEDAATSIDQINTWFNNAWPAAPMQFPPMRVLAKSSNGNDLKIIANQYDSVNSSIVFCGDNTTNFSNPWLPQFYYAEIIWKLFRTYGYSVKGDALEDPFFLKQICTNYKPLHSVRLTEESAFRTNETQTITGSTFVMWHLMDYNNSVLPVTSFPSQTVYIPPATGVWYQLWRLKLKIKDVVGTGVKMRVYHRLDQLNLFPTPYFEYDVFPGDEINIILAPANQSNFLVNYTDKLRIDVLNGSIVLDSGCELVQNVTQSPNADDYSPILVFNPEVRLSNHIPPDITVAEFLTAVKKAFQLKIDIDEPSKSVTLSIGNDFIQGTDTKELTNVLDDYTKERVQRFRYKVKWANDYEPIPNDKKFGTINSFNNPPFIAPEGSYIYVANENAYYVKESTGWKYHGIKNDFIEVGDNGIVKEIVIPIRLGELRSDAPGQTDGYLITIESPYMNQLAAQDLFGENKGMVNDPWDLEIMTYYGIRPNRNGNMPFVSTVAFLYDGTIIDDIYLVFDLRDKSSFQRYHRALFQLLSNYVTFKVRIANGYRTFVEQYKGKKIVWRNTHFLDLNSNGTLGETEGITEIELIRL